MRKLLVGQKFKCEDLYYVIARGNICYDGFFFTKSNNLLVQRLDWKFSTSKVYAIDDFKNREYFNTDEYKLEPIGIQRKFITLKRCFHIEEFEEAVRIVIWLKTEERETNKGRKRYDKTFMKFKKE